MRLYPRFIPRSTDSGNDARLPKSRLTVRRAHVSRTTGTSAGATVVMVGANQTRPAPAATTTGRNSNQTAMAPPT